MSTSRFELLGFCDLQEIQNVFTTEMSKIDDEIRQNGVPQNHRLLVEWIDNIRLLLIKRAKRNMAAYLANNPEVKAMARDDRMAETAKAQTLTHKERIAKSRERARLGES